MSLGLIVACFLILIILFSIFFYKRGWNDGSGEAYHDLWREDSIAKQVSDYHNNPPKD